MSKLKSAVLAVLTIALFAVFAGPAAARDRNRDGLPDRWEKAHHLSLKVNQARRDQDKDGLRNKAEFRAHMDPRVDDSDNDGVEDGDENAGTIDSFDAAAGKLTIKLFSGDKVSGLVTDATEIECDDSTAKSSDQGDDDQSGDDDHGGPGDDDQGDDNDEQGDSCGTDALTAGRQVKEADLELANGKATFEKVELGK